MGERARFAALVPFNLFLQIACVRFESFLALFERLAPGFLDWAGRWRARRAFYRAARSVPAYREFLASAEFHGEPAAGDRQGKLCAALRHGAALRGRPPAGARRDDR